MRSVKIATYPRDIYRDCRGPLRHLLRSEAHGREGLVRLVLHGPLPVHAYHPRGEGIRWSTLSRARLTSWRILVVETEVPVGVVEIGHADPRHVRVRGAEPANALYAALQVVAEQLAAWRPAERFDLRVLEVPSRFTTAIWLAGRRSLFFPTRLDGCRCSPGRVLDPAALVMAVGRSRGASSRVVSRRARPLKERSR